MGFGVGRGFWGGFGGYFVNIFKTYFLWIQYIGGLLEGEKTLSTRGSYFVKLGIKNIFTSVGFPDHDATTKVKFEV